MPSTLQLRIHAAPCSNVFGLGNLHGGPRKPVMPIGDVGKVLREATGLVEQGWTVSAEIVDEPTRHPDFVQVQERLIGGRLVAAGRPYVLATTGEGLTSCPEGHIQRLRQAGVGGVVMNFCGEDRTHDAFVGRPGAFAGQVAAARRLMELEVEIAAHLVVHRASAPEVPGLRNRLLSIGPKPPTVAIVVPESTGRAAEPDMRARLDDLADWTDGMRQALKARTEAEWAEHVRQTEGLAETRLGDLDPVVHLDIYGDLSVYANRRAALPYTYLPQLRVGKLGTAPLAALAAQAEQIPLLARLRAATCRELSETCHAESPILCTLRDVLENVWGLRLLASLNS